MFLLFCHTDSKICSKRQMILSQRKGPHSQIACCIGTFYYNPTLFYPCRRNTFKPRFDGPTKNRCFRMVLKRRNIGCNPILINENVIIGPDDVLSLGCRNGSIPGIRQTLYFFKHPDERQHFGMLGDNVFSVIGAVVVDNDELPGDPFRDSQPAHRFKGLIQQSGPVPGADGNSDIHKIHLTEI